MATSGRKCVECGGAVELFSGMMINGAAYHASCWDGRVKPVPKTPPAPGLGQARPSGGTKAAS